MALAQSSVRAEDIDIFTGTTASATVPNVLFIIDNTANWSQAFVNEMAALAGTFSGLPVNTDGSAKF
jgi:type IV pilus assembly protein PilY1